MATVSLKHVSTGEIRPATVGFSWTSLAFTFFVPMFRGHWLYALGMFLWAVIFGAFTAGIGIIVPALYQAITYNKKCIRLLSEKGFTPADESSRNIMKAHGLFFESTKQ
ncbi:MAG: DUF2628 domain-containing protein [Gammaproteobacteria bacterium]